MKFFFDPGWSTAIELHWRQPRRAEGRTQGRTLRRHIFIQPVQKKAARFLAVLFFLFSSFDLLAQNTRTDISLNTNWYTVANDSNMHAFDGFENASFNTKKWLTVNVPHNWDEYEGYRRLLHGNRHGYAWYRTSFKVKKQKGKRYFLWFEGVGSYATVWLNGKKAGYHAGGRTTFTIDITDYLQPANILAVRADHPAFITDLPWVCGGCSDERGFSEGSQPMGIFRPVHLITTNEVRIEPFGVHAWNDTTVSGRSANISVATTIKNYSNTTKEIEIYTMIVDAKGRGITASYIKKQLQAQTSIELPNQFTINNRVHLWSLPDPYLYHIISEIKENGKLVDSITTPYGIRWISWPVGKTPSSNQFLLNGQPVFINGIAEYEHLLGNSHAFSDEEIASRVKMIRSAGFNAFRDGHQPHNLRYQNYWDSLGVLWWTQLSAHVWYDTKEFRDNFKTLLKEWVIERRNSPSVILWGLQNESKLPADFAKECTELIRSLDPTSPSQRLVTTCNGGEGTDWDVPQNWTGTYGGDPLTYATDLKRQILVGEYGAWRTIDLHSEGGFKQNGILTEDRMTALMETKIDLAESVKDSVAGHFFWLLTSHDNPGRVQGGEGFRELDRIGPVNYKGLFTPWEEPTDAYYMFRSNYANKENDPMIYIVSHTWPDRWTQPGIKDGIIVYSNCDEVELFNDINNISLGKKKNRGRGTHFQWDKVNINYNVLFAVGYVNGKVVVRDTIFLNHLPQSPNLNKLYSIDKSIVKPQPGYHYNYMIDCGGPTYIDENGNRWLADQALLTGDARKSERENQTWGSLSWTNEFPGMPAFFASQRKTSAPIAGTKDWPLFQNFRYGRERLKYEFNLENGDYLVELYFIEPWFGIGSKMDCSGMRLFDIAFNDNIVIKNLDIWKETGSNRVLKKIIPVKVNGKKLVISFPHVAAGQAVISAIAIASKKDELNRNRMTPNVGLVELNEARQYLSTNTWLNTGDKQYYNDTVTFSSLPPALFGAEWIQLVNHTKEPENKTLISFQVNTTSDVYVAIDSSIHKPAWLNDFEDTKTFLTNDGRLSNLYRVYRKRYKAYYEKVELKGLGDVSDSLPMYSVMIVPVSGIQPAYDLKPVTIYRSINANLGPAVIKSTVNEKEAVTFNDNAGTIEWQIKTGVADIYSLTFRYANTTAKDLIAKMEFLQADGKVLKTEQLMFTQSKPGKWNYAVTNTGTMINAGNYIIRLTSANAVGLSITGVDVQ